MIELGELEAHHEDFARRQARVVVVSLEEQDEAKKTQNDYPHLVVVADPKRKLISAAEVLHPKAGQAGEDVAAPTTFFIDRQGVVQSLFRPRQVITRLSANEVLARVDADLPSAK
jgi:peroxiredoxin